MIVEHRGKRPNIHPTAYIAPNAVVSGDVTIGPDSRVLYGAVLTSEGAPTLKKVRRLVSNNKKDSFVGTDFSYGDVIGHRPNDWSHKILRNESVDGKDCFVVESLPKTPEIADNSGYSKRISWIDKESFIALKGEAYDSGGQLLKKFAAKKIEKIDAKNNKWQPMYLEAENVQGSHKTILEFKNFKANVGVSDDKFTTRYLEKQ
jgi:uncharacterized protein